MQGNICNQTDRKSFEDKKKLNSKIHTKNITKRIKE